jgi:hypothetical protein
MVENVNVHLNELNSDYYKSMFVSKSAILANAFQSFLTDD